jgi:hypothetical protein
MKVSVLKIIRTVVQGFIKLKFTDSLISYCDQELKITTVKEKEYDSMTVFSTEQFLVMERHLPKCVSPLSS